MAETEAWEGIVREGELLFIPALGVHVFESVGASFGLKLMHHDRASAEIGRKLLELGSQAVDEILVEMLEELRMSREMPSLQIADIADKLGCLE
mmetsp:Transcript_8335/g.12642  ORF Transcript_8335/g.12642 Transcript_8335/m.12642 type:complete len:94 (+) Transcript_8335:1-282(+)